jgi:hypothetical protein
MADDLGLDVRTQRYRRRHGRSERDFLGVSELCDE